MPIIDDKIVAMSFESSKFESGVNKSITAIDRLKAALSFSNAGRGLDNINRKAADNQLGLIGKAIDSILPKLETLRLVAIGVLSQIATKAVFAGAQLAHSLTIAPVIGGLQEYATNLNSIQTILANTQAAGTGLEEVNKALQELNEYSDRTIYNFAQMARNIGTFTAAGVGLETATGAIKGIANLAALSGSSAEQASTAMYQLSQAISAGRVSLMDWNSVVNAGMGGTVFQRALATTATQMGKLEKGALKLVGPMKNVSINGESFRNSISGVGTDGESWLTSDVLTRTLQQFTGDLTKAELAAQGFNDAQIKSILATAKVAQEAATQVKTLEGVISTAKETAVSGWAQTWQIVFGDFEEAKELFTGISEAINGFITKSADARNKILADWKQLGGRTQLIESFKNVFEALGDVLAPIKEAFREFFPAKTGQDLFRFTSNLLRFTEKLKPSEETVDLLRRTFRGLFAVFSIGREILGGIIDVFQRVFGEIFKGSGSFLEVTASIGDFLVKVEETLREGGHLETFFQTLGDILVAPVKMLGELKGVLEGVFSGLAGGSAASGMDAMERTLEVLVELWDRFIEVVGRAGDVIEPVVETYVKSLGTVGDALLKAFKEMDFDAMVKVVQTGLFGGLVLSLKKFLGKGSFVEQLTSGFAGVGKGFVSNITDSFTALTNALVALQQQIKAQTMLDLAIAVGILAASIVALSFVDPKKLTNAMTAITVAFGQLLGGMVLMTLITRTAGFIKMPFIAASMILLAGAILVLSASVLVLSRLSWDSLLKGLVGVGSLLAIISAASIPLSANAAGMIRAGIGIAAIGTGLLILALAVKVFGDMEWGEIAKGLVGVGVGLAILVGVTALMPRGGMVGIGLGLILVAASLKILANVIAEFGNMDWKVMAVGLGGMAAALLIIAGAMKLMPKSLPFTAAGLVLVAAALQGVVFAVKALGGMSLEEIGKGLGTLAGALAILSFALKGMTFALPGAVALAIAAGALTLLIPPLITLGSLSWVTIVTGLAALAATFVVLGSAGALLTPAIPALLGLGAALFLIGAALALTGIGLAGIATAFSAIIVALPAGMGIIVKSFTQFQRAMVESVKLFILGLLEIVQGIADVAPEFVKALVDILEQLIKAVIQATPMLVEMFNVLIQGMLEILNQNRDPIIEAAFELLLALLQGIRDNIEQITVLVAEIVTKFITALAGEVPRLVTAGVNLLLALIRGVTSNIGRLVAAVANLIVAFINGLSSAYGRIIAAGANLIVNLITGLGQHAGRIVTAGVNAVIKFIEGLGKNAVKLANAAGRVILDFLEGLRDAVDTYAPQITEATIDIGIAIVAGVIEGIGSKADDLRDALVDLLPGPLKHLAGKLGLASPSKLFRDRFGKGIMDGFILGITQNADRLDRAITDTGDTAIESMRESLRGITAAVNEIDANPTITPVLDLSVVQSQAKQLAKMTDVAPINAAVSLRAASTISPVQTEEMAPGESAASMISFEQNNYSPKALNEVEIYRQTKNQLSQVKSVLAFT